MNFLSSPGVFGSDLRGWLRRGSGGGTSYDDCCPLFDICFICKAFWWLDGDDIGVECAEIGADDDGVDEDEDAPGDAVAGFDVLCTFVSFVVATTGTVDDFLLLPKFNCDNERGKRDRNGALTVGVVTGTVGDDVTIVNGVDILLLMLVFLLLFIDFSKYAEPCVYEIFFLCVFLYGFFWCD